MLDAILLVLLGVVIGMFALYKYAQWWEAKEIAKHPEAVQQRIDELNAEAVSSE